MANMLTQSTQLFKRGLKNSINRKKPQLLAFCWPNKQNIRAKSHYIEFAATEQKNH